MSSWAVEIAADYPTRAVIEAVKDVWDALDADRRIWAAIAIRSGFSETDDSEFVRAALAREDDTAVIVELRRI